MKFPFVGRSRHDADLARQQERLNKAKDDARKAQDAARKAKDIARKAKDVARESKDLLQESRNALEQLREERAREVDRLREVVDLCEDRAKELETMHVSLAEARRGAEEADVVRHQMQGHQDLRSLLAKKLTGKGIEIGALHRPLPLPPGVVAQYVDLRSREENIAVFPHLPAQDMVETTIVCDCQTLAGIPDESQDFVIANHVVEHCVNALLVLKTLFRVLKPMGRMFVSIPDKRFTFDFRRPVTTWEHVLQDFQDGRLVEEEPFFEEYRQYVDPEMDVAEAAAARRIHYHAWTQAEVLELFNKAKHELGWKLEIEFFAKQGSEVVLVVQKADPVHEDHSELYQRMQAEAAAKAEEFTAEPRKPDAEGNGLPEGNAVQEPRDISASSSTSFSLLNDIPGGGPPREDRPRYMPAAKTTGCAHVQIEQTWSNDQDVGLSGFALVNEGTPQDIRITCEGVPPEIIEWHDRPDVYVHASFAGFVRHVRCGFRAWFRRRANHQITLSLPDVGGTKEVNLILGATGFPPGPPCDPIGMPVRRFAEQVNRECRTVLEIGSRVVSPGSSSKRSLFAPHVRYTGFDIYPDANTDVVGDAHQLGSYFPEGTTFDAIFSLSVLEHLTMPWKVAVEINKLLPMGGLAYHSSPFTWPLHEEPWDFWRFSHEGLRALFSPALGFQVLSLGFTNPCRVHFEMPISTTGHSPLHPTFGGSHILVRKVKECSIEDFRWNATLEQVLPPQSAYPLPAARGIPPPSGSES